MHPVLGVRMYEHMHLWARVSTDMHIFVNTNVFMYMVLWVNNTRVYTLKCALCASPS